jgi:hypothetical protein
MNSHTPGPWACTYTSNHAHDYRLTQPNGQPLPVNAEANDRSEQRANARLIAAAPEMFAALQWFDEQMRDDSALDMGKLINEMEQRTRAAIAKATQEQK